jgi:hypothetical protein
MPIIFRQVARRHITRFFRAHADISNVPLKESTRQTAVTVFHVLTIGEHLQQQQEGTNMFLSAENLLQYKLTNTERGNDHYSHYYSLIAGW